MIVMAVGVIWALTVHGDYSEQGYYSQYNDDFMSEM
jgi:hypothetical protein